MTPGHFIVGSTTRSPEPQTESPSTGDYDYCITNVATGTSAMDAVNVAQLNTALAGLRPANQWRARLHGSASRVDECAHRRPGAIGVLNMRRAVGVDRPRVQRQSAAASGSIARVKLAAILSAASVTASSSSDRL